MGNGWSIEGPLDTGLETMQAGGTINITARETCTFSHASASASAHYYFCYDGVCGSTHVAGDGNDAAVTNAIDSILDDNNNIILDGHTSTDNTNGKKIILPMGKSCDGLEMRADTPAATEAITKDVEKNNNGKVFKITRSFLQKEDNVGEMDAGSGTAFTFNNGKGHSALAGVSSLLISEVSSCGAVTSLAAETTGDDAALPVSRTLTGVTESGAASTATISGIATSNTDSSKCSYSLQRYVITLDSMPTSSAAGNNAVAYKKLLYKSPVGSCNVAETTKGTFESYECSNRGACDGKSGLCACYAGYSGESCQTQTVLV